MPPENRPFVLIKAKLRPDLAQRVMMYDGNYISSAADICGQQQNTITTSSQVHRKSLIKRGWKDVSTEHYSYLDARKVAKKPPSRPSSKKTLKKINRGS